ncbi:hypothetical protein FACS189459_3880 [Bacilli bacterium]|nr:hypothetical protein FACS189459_3880 [Bacilli bacterium]
MEFDAKDEYHLPHKGHMIEPMVILNDVDLLGQKEHGTTIEFLPDFSIMEKAPWEYLTIAARLKQLAYLNKGIKIVLNDEYSNKEIPTHDE